ncbi:Ubiquitin carboxyl-terminal hydrolase 16 [Linnemannia schmuckeri]|uniref:ubiquitinyl hydrolase 1 n=1 Tax=Linnemannia schmuckeri TaxID=64567 RepID=A0A9P5VFN4_9FUNG|nr:Ubiquitin carboxyl-terminal hydrolase 16 [Linnemannia schmuckeri]
MGKKKKGGRRLSQSDFAGEDAILTEILTSSRKSGRVEDPKAERALAFPPKPAVPVATAVPEPSAANATEETSIGSAPVPIDSPEVADSSTHAADHSEPTTTGSGGKCQHVKSAVNLNKLRKGIAHQKDWDHCLGCKTAESKAKKLAQRMDTSLSKLSLSESEGSAVGADEPLLAESLWMCLSCCEINCGRALKKHALAHHDGKKNNHPLAINLGNMDCWCYDCDNTIVPSKNRNQVIHECQNIIEKTLQIKQSKMRAASMANSKKTKGTASETIIVASLPKAKVFTPGLQNLGNTCFFNSVVQVLTETKSLRSILSEDGEASSRFPKSLAASTDAGLGPLTTTFKDFLFTMWKQQGGTIAPRDLFTQIAKKWKVFRGFRQQDSQELMRYLFDGIKHEELDMIKRHLSEEGSSQDEKAEGVEEEKKESAGLDEKEPKFVPFIDSCFSGKLVSVIVCDACKKCSYAPEDFFDLSLPIRGPIQAGAVAGSSLKARLLAHSKKSVAATEAAPTADDEPADEKDPLPESDRPSEAHLRHVGKLLKSIGPSTSEDLSIQRSLNQFTSVDRLDGENKFACENCYKLIQAAKVKEGGGSVEQGDKPDTSNELEETSMKEAAKNELVQEVETSEMTVVPPESNSNDSGEDDDEEESSGEERTDSLGNTIPKKVKKVESKAAESKKPAEEPKHIFRRAYKRYLISDLPPTLVLHLKRFESSGRFGQMRKIEDHVDIPVELDMAPYFVPKNEIEEEEENESEIGSEVRKEEEENNSKSKKYRLYGAVVHMGTLGGGHYINYILSSKVQVAEVAAKVAAAQGKEKANSKSTTIVNGLELPDIPLAVMLAQQKEKAEEKKKGLALVDKDASLSSPSAANAETTEGEEKAAEQEVVPAAVQEEDKRQWIACSDSSVRLSSLQEVLASRAYLLFYERC